MYIYVCSKMFPTSVDKAGNLILGSLILTHCLLTAYNIPKINCHGTTNIKGKYKNSLWLDTQFYLVDVPGLAILGLPTSITLKVMTMNCTISVQQQSINTGVDLMLLYPDYICRL